MYGNVESLCCVPGTNIINRLYFTQINSQKKRADVWVPEEWLEAEGIKNEGSQK